METEKRILSFVLAAAATISYGHTLSAEENKGIVNYSKFTVHVNKTAAHDAYDVYNGIIEPDKATKGGVDRSKLKFCDPDTGNWIEALIPDTDYMEKDKAIIADEESGKVPSAPFYRAKPGEKPCDLILEGTVIKVTAVRTS